MTAITVRATDSQKAMEELIRRLGPDALILSTTRVGGMVEVTAIPPDGMVPAAKAPPAEASDPAMDALLAAAPALTSRMVEAATLAARNPARTQPDPLSPAPATDAARQPVFRPLDPRAPRLDAAPRPHPVPPDPSPGEPSTYDFASALRAEAARAVPTTDPVTRLARNLLPPQGLEEEIPPRLLIAGPPGAGKSMLAARIAAHWMLAVPEIRPQIIAPVPGTLLVEDRLRGWARLMGLTLDRPHVAAAMNLPEPDPYAPQIIDLSDIPADAPALAARLIELDGAELVLCLPAGLHPARVARVCHDWQAFAPTVTLTGLDLWWPEQGELVAIADAGLRLTRTAAGTGLVQALSRPGPDDLRNWTQGWTPAYAGAAE